MEPANQFNGRETGYSLRNVLRYAEQDVNKLKTLNGDVLGNFANKDGWINPKVVAKFADDMKASGKKLYLHQYDADHGFANPSNPIYNSEATKDAYANTVVFLKARLK